MKLHQLHGLKLSAATLARRSRPSNISSLSHTLVDYVLGTVESYEPAVDVNGPTLASWSSPYARLQFEGEESSISSYNTIASAQTTVISIVTVWTHRYHIGIGRYSFTCLSAVDQYSHRAWLSLPAAPGTFVPEIIAPPHTPPRAPPPPPRHRDLLTRLSVGSAPEMKSLMWKDYPLMLWIQQRGVTHQWEDSYI